MKISSVVWLHIYPVLIGIDMFQFYRLQVAYATRLTQTGTQMTAIPLFPSTFFHFISFPFISSK